MHTCMQTHTYVHTLTRTHSPTRFTQALTSSLTFSILPLALSWEFCRHLCQTNWRKKLKNTEKMWHTLNQLLVSSSAFQLLWYIKQTCTHTLTRAQWLMHTHTCAHTHAHTHTRAHTRAHTRTRTHTHTHTHTHTCTFSHLLTPVCGNC